MVEGIADAAAFAEAVAGGKHTYKLPCRAHASREDAIARKGILCESAKREGERCLSCNVVCQTCADVCPNRANVVVKLPDGRAQLLHVDRMCNECGNCLVFCRWAAARCWCGSAGRWRKLTWTKPTGCLPESKF